MSNIGVYNYFPLEFGGGGEAVATMLCNGLANSGNDVTYYADAAFNGITRYSEEHISRIGHTFTYRKVQFRQYSKKGRRWLFRPFPTMAQLSANSKVMIFVDRVPPKAFLEKVVSANRRVGLLLHGIAPTDNPKGDFITTGYQILVRAMLRRVAGLLKKDVFFFQVFNKETRRYLLDLGINSSNIFVIPNGVNSSRFLPPKKSDKFIIVFSGRIETHTKGIDILKAISKRVASDDTYPLHIDIFGSGKDSHMLSGYNPPGKVVYHGFVSEAERLEVMSRASLSLITSRIEPFSLVCVESLMSGVPVVSTPVSGPRGVLSTDSSYGKIVSFNENEIYDTLASFQTEWSQDPVKYLDKRLRIALTAKTTFSSQKMIHDYLTLLDAL